MFKKSNMVGFGIAGIITMILTVALNIAIIAGTVYGVIWVLKHFAII